MDNNQLSKKIHAGPKYLRYFFFVAGIVATIAYRITPFLNPFWVRVAWYTGTIGFILYFWHRSRIETKRARLVKDYNLVDEVNNSNIQGKEKETILYLVKTSLTSKARYNSAFIVIVSAFALLMSLIMDLRIF